MASSGKRVDNVAWWWRPFHLTGWWVVTLLVFAGMLAQRATCRIEVIGGERLEQRPNHIFAYWHENVWSLFLFLLFAGRGHVWMQHPARYMKGVHDMLTLLGIRYVLGSGGDEGRRAADAVADAVRAGASTAVAPDGPGGPVRVLKRGVLHMAVRSGVPVTPLAFRHSRAWRAPTWDRKWIALPLSRITVEVGEVIPVTTDAVDRAARCLAAAL